MNIAVVGLGIIGGSFCKAFKKYTNHHIIGMNRTLSTAQKALDTGAIDEIGAPETLGKADLIILTMYPQADVEFIEKTAIILKRALLLPMRRE